MKPGLRLALCAAALALACKVDKDAFHERLWSCNPNAADPACGTDLADRPMACVPAYQLGGSNFCATGCDATADPETTGEGVCVRSGPPTAGAVSGARLASCNPAAGDTCGDGLSCLRTDLVADEGICTTVGSCAADQDCRDPVRSKCMGSLLRETYANAGLKSDHTYCLQAECRARRTACSPGETCMRDIIPRTSYPPDICVPHCDANGNCPPNYFCYPRVYGPGAPRVCIPGLLGLRCESKTDCLFGDCVAIEGAPYKVCSVPCAGDADCEKYDSIQGTFFCNQAGQCMGARGFKGGFCNNDAECIYPGEICGRVTNTIPQGVCMLACAADRSCPAPGGVPHACRPQLDRADKLDPAQPWVCWPGYFAQLCTAPKDCFPGLDCLRASPTLPPELRLCTLPCATDEECDKHHFTREGYCAVDRGICVAKVIDGKACERARMCESGSCNPGSKTCDPTPGY